MSDFLVLRVIAKLLIPFILLFGFYVQMHGDYGPGGGFQAGVIVAAAFVLYAIVFDVKTARRVAPMAALVSLACLGVLLYAGVGVANLIYGGRFLEYGALAHDPAHGNHIGILIIEIGVGIAVAAVMMIIFFSFARRR
ncbi:MAG: Na(+)/H(+) antiporter subunit B [Rhodospirillaceae bacterium]|jgi:multicomponent Na+:H+ antiporter subunit B|nr:Na(+)/H(+) antiporter subunit B [Rhodospirillaceae bacterium]MBT3627557.1 Na(+)/H(+) antiporter subunit B [Rhodospirillaceae bacterium]MBT3928911.1 Na(+)/H(+) antiporter subunit B [Rhodospirillaceae bacterium]MBT5038417.1 Na(+)/H(+) antiporter subunit B [Rhodospirillaceae bacterium]MBT5676139.1 Na(+)/H(+) antiporter subunit B [Rhodospirillaceae bacterium]